MKIAVAIDGSDYAFRAAEHAITLATHFPKSELEIIFVKDYSKAKDEYLTTQSVESLELKREKKIQPIIELATEANIETKTIILKGKPSYEIIQYVNDNNIEHLVLGSRGLNTLQEMILGSVSHKVMKHVNCPVTIVK